jgi:hypothetical protein
MFVHCPRDGAINLFTSQNRPTQTIPLYNSKIKKNKSRKKWIQPSLLPLYWQCFSLACLKIPRQYKLLTPAGPSSTNWSHVHHLSSQDRQCRRPSNAARLLKPWLMTVLAKQSGSSTASQPNVVSVPLSALPVSIYFPQIPAFNFFFVQSVFYKSGRSSILYIAICVILQRIRYKQERK